MANAVSWFEIPVTDMDRAVSFYNTILGTKLDTDTPGPDGYKMAMIPVNLEAGDIGGALIRGEGYVPTHQGALVYLNGGDDLSVALGKVEGAGGKVLMPKTGIGEDGFYAYFEDSEGNKVGLHSMG